MLEDVPAHPRLQRGRRRHLRRQLRRGLRVSLGRRRPVAGVAATAVVGGLLMPLTVVSPAAATPLAISDGAAVNLSATAGRSLRSATAGAGDNAYVVWGEEGSEGGVMFRALHQQGTVADPVQRVSSAAGVELVGRPVVAASGSDVVVAWSEIVTSVRLTHSQDVVVDGAVSHDSGRTWTSISVSDAVGGIGWEPRLATANGVVYSVFQDYETKHVLAVALDGAVRWEHDLGPGSTDSYDVSADGNSFHVVRADDAGMVSTVDSIDRGKDLASPVQLSDSGTIGSQPRIASAAGKVVAAFIQTVAGQPSKRSVVATGSTDGGGSWLRQSMENAPVAGDSGVAVAIGNGRAHVAWSDGGTVYEAASGDGLGGFSPSVVSSHGSYDDPELSVSGDSVYVTWFATDHAAGASSPDVYTAARRGGDVWTITNASQTPGTSYDAHVVGFADGFLTVWGEASNADLGTGNHDVWARPSAYGKPDLQVVAAAAVQVAQGAKRLVDGRPVVGWVRLRNAFARPLTTTVTWTFTYETYAGRTTDKRVQPVTLRPGVTDVWFDPGESDQIRPLFGTLKLEAQVDQEQAVVEDDESNNITSASYEVVETKPLSVLVQPYTFVGLDAPTCAEVTRMADHLRDFLKGAWPTDPDKVRVDVTCSAQHVPWLWSDSRMPLGIAFSTLAADNLGDVHDQYIGVVTQGFIGKRLTALTDDHTWEDLTGVGGKSPQGEDTKYSIVEQQLYNGPVAAHEMAHTRDWVTTGLPQEDADYPFHMSVDAPGYWVQRHEAIQHSDLMAPVADPGGSVQKWVSALTWEHLVDSQLVTPSSALKAPAAAARALAASAGPAPTSLAVSGRLGSDGKVVQATLRELEEEGPSVSLGARLDGALTARYLDASGATLAEAPVPLASTDAAGHVKDVFSARLPWVEGTVRLQLIGADGTVVLDRPKSQHAPAVEVAAAAGVVAVGSDVTLSASATDDDGDPVTTTLEASTDGGTSWTPLGAVGLGSLTLPAPREWLGKQVLVRATASDGWQTTQATAAPFVVGSGVSNGRLAYVATGSGDKPAVHTVNADGTDDRTIPASVGLGQPDWSADGSKLAVTYDTADGRVGNDVALVNADGTGLTPLHLNELLASGGTMPDYQYYCPRLSPDGQWLLVDETRQNNPSWVLYKIRLDGTSSYQYSTFYGDPGYDCSSFNPDGSRAAYGFGGYQHKPIVQTSSFPSTLPDGGYDEDNPTWQGANWPNSPDYQYERQPQYSPEGATLLYQRENLTTHETSLWTTPSLPHTDPVPLPTAVVPPQAGVTVSDARWSPVGDWIVYTRQVDGQPAEIWHVKPDGTSAEKMPLSGGGLGYATWGRGSAGDGGDSDAQVTVTLTLSAPATAHEGSDVTVTASGSEGTVRWDLDGDGGYDDATGTTATLHAEAPGAQPVRAQLTAADGSVATAEAMVDVQDVAPVLSLVEGQVEGSVAKVSARATDVGAAGMLSATVDWKDGGAPEQLELVLDGDTVQLEGSHAYSGTPPTAVRVTVNDGFGGNASASVTLSAPAQNLPPVAVTSATTLPADTSVLVTGLGFDPELHPVTVAVTGTPAHGTVDVVNLPSGPVARYTPVKGWSGTDEVRFTVSDGRETSAPAVLTFTVTPVTTPPTPSREVYRVEGFLPPVTTPQMSAKAGSAIPFKWRLFDASGAELSALAVVRSYAFPENGGSYELSYDSVGHHYVVNAKTGKAWKGKTLVFTVTLTNGQTLAVPVAFT